MSLWYILSLLSREGKSHRHRVLQVGHDNSGYGQHEAAHNLFGVIIVLGVGKWDAGAVDSHPATPLDPHHESTHGEDHSQHIHVVRCKIIIWSIFLIIILCIDNGLWRHIANNALRSAGITCALHAVFWGNKSEMLSVQSKSE